MVYCDSVDVIILPTTNRNAWDPHIKAAFHKMVQSKEMLVIWDSHIFVQTCWLFGTFIIESKQSLKSTAKDNRNLRRAPVALSIGTDRYHQNARVQKTCSSVECQKGIVTSFPKYYETEFW